MYMYVIEKQSQADSQADPRGTTLTLQGIVKICTVKALAAVLAAANATRSCDVGGSSFGRRRLKIVGDFAALYGLARRGNSDMLLIRADQRIDRTFTIRTDEWISQPTLTRLVDARAEQDTTRSMPRCASLRSIKLLYNQSFGHASVVRCQTCTEQL